MTTYTLHREVGQTGFGFDFPSVSHATDTTHHAEQAAEDADSASCSLDGFDLPDYFKLLDDGTMMLGFQQSETVEEERATEVAGEKVVTTGRVFEADVNHRGEVVKVAARVTYTESHDLCVVANPQDGTVITAWVNSVEDRHSSLDESRYDTLSDTPLV